MTLGVGMSLVALWSSWQQLDLFMRVFRGERVSEAVLAASDTRQGIIGVVELVLGIVAAIVFLMWLHRARVALDRAGVVGLRYSPRWTWLGFVVPLLNLFRPYQVIAEVSRASEPRTDASAGTPAVIKTWWAMLLLSGVAGRLFFAVAANPTTEVQYMIFAWLSVIVDVLGALSAFLAYLVVREIDRRQEQLFGTRAATPPASAIPA